MNIMEIPKIDPFWDEQLVNQVHGGHRHTPNVPQPVVGSIAAAHSPYERNLNFATVAVEDGDYGFPKKKTVRDPLSHRIIEKRRRDRMNNCLADLARLLPPSSLRKGRGRIEKTEIVELAIKHLRHLQCHPCPMGDKCEYSVGIGAENSGGVQNNSPSCSSSSTSSGYQTNPEETFRLGFQECLSEAMHFLVEQEGLYAGDATCVRLVKHLNNHCETVLRDHWGNQGKVIPGFRRNANAEAGADFKKQGGSAGSSSSGYHPNGSSSGSDGNGGNEPRFVVYSTGLDGESTEPFALPVQNPPHHSSNMESSRYGSSVMDYEAENSCSSTPLSIETSDVLSLDEKNTSRMSSKPPIPSIICSHSSSTNSRIPVNSGSPANGSTNGRSSDDGSANSSTSSAHHRYKFKSNIKQRFTADCQTGDTRFHPGSGGKANSQCDTECDRDNDASSDTEEIRDDGISVLEESLLKSSRHGGGEEPEGKNSSSQSPGNRRCSLSGKKETQISGDNISSNHEKLDGSMADLKSSSEVERSGTPEVKPSPEELLSAIHSLSTPGGQNKSQFPKIFPGEGNIDGDKRVPVFALHEKGSFYVPMTIDKSIVTSYTNQFEAAKAPSLYPVTISVCFLLGPEKKGKLENLPGSDLSSADCDKATDLSQANGNATSLPLVSVGHPTILKSNSRRGYRESNNFVANRFSHQRMISSKESSNHHGRGLGHGGSSQFHATYQDGSSTTTSPIPNLNDLNRGSPDQTDHHSGGGNRCHASGSSSGSSSIMGSATRGRKRSISSSPSMSGSANSIGYHSWNEKSSPSSHDFFNFHANTHNLPAIALHGHLTAAAAAAAAAVSSGTLSSMGQRHHNQAMNGFHTENMLREKEMCFAQEKRSKKARSMDQTLESKQYEKSQ